MSNSPSKSPILHIIGGGLAGTEAAWQAAKSGVQVVLHEMRPNKSSPAHTTSNLAELVCSNSFRSDDHEANAVGLLHEEMRRCDSLVMRAADENSLPAGGALAVDRVGFSKSIEAGLETLPNVKIDRAEVNGWPPSDWEHVIIATGPLTSQSLAEAIQAKTGEEALAFFDAIAPIVLGESINRDIVWAQSRYDKPGPSGTGADYLNCPMTEAEYNRFVDALIESEQHQFHEWENVPYFDGCMPIEEMARRGRETLRFGPMKPVGLTNPNNPDEKPYAIVQLRQDNALGTLWNIVGFQTKMKYRNQAEILRLIPGLEEAKFARLGGLHHNTFLNSPKVLGADLTLSSEPRVRFAGQITGVEGYVESAAIGLMAGRLSGSEMCGASLDLPSPETAHGALLSHITGGHLEDKSAKLRSFQPMNVNFGLFPDIEVKKPEGVKRWRKADRNKVKKKAVSARALASIENWHVAYSASQ